MDLNRATIIGTMVTDPELRKAGDKSVCNFRIAVNRYTKDGNKAEYINVVCWDKLAENISTFLSKGSRLYAEGRLQTREWVSADGQKRTTTEIVANDVIFLDKKESPARSTQSVTNMTGDATEMFVLENMDKNV